MYKRTQSASSKPRSSVSASSSFTDISLAFSSSATKRSPHLSPAEGEVEATTANSSEHLLLQPKPTSGTSQDDFSSLDTGTSSNGKASKSHESLQQLVGLSRTSGKISDLAHILNGSYAKGDRAKASEVVDLLDKSESGIVEPVQPSRRLLGAVNREGVTCYLDSLLFAMFAVLDSYEAMLHQRFDDEPRKRLALMLRIWVNLFRTGRLITADITRQLQLALAACGWKEAAESRQQDPSEAYSFITDKLALPMLTLKMTLFHNGKEDADSDHKLVHERVIEVPVPNHPENGQSITLEDCLAAYFDNQVIVERYLQRRRTTIGSVRSMDDRKALAETDVRSISESQPSTPLAASFQDVPSPVPPLGPGSTLVRKPTLFNKLVDPEKGELAELHSNQMEDSRPGRRRALSSKVEVKMPAFQFFSLIPWYTPAEDGGSAPSTNSQVVDHFKSHSPIVPIALKWSQMDGTRMIRRESTIDIPLTYDMPHFITDDTESEDPLHGHFILVLQGFLCHRGTKPDSGHYVSAARCRDAQDGGYQWLLNDDLASPRVSTVDDIKALLKNEKPYLLFYQVEPISALGEPPAYSDSVSTDPIVVGSTEIAEPPHSQNETTGKRSLDESSDNRGRSSMTSDNRRDLALANRSMDGRKENRNPKSTTDAPLDPQGAGNVPRQNSGVSENSSTIRQNGRVKDKRSSMSLSRMTGRLAKGKSSTSLSGMENSALQASESTALNAPVKLDVARSGHKKSHHARNGRQEGSDRRECILM
ncbi:MAG: hypothetical protein Q9195_002587 [Heterodermia aff. obscurata]